ncbi:hypothetical protein [Streptomyces sp. NPDC056669]|uniref:hypothetical protein n=1 Tax=unclassified Streptomyces TaxID=2593676 RepID=UPI0036BCE3ED
MSTYLNDLAAAVSTDLRQLTAYDQVVRETVMETPGERQVLAANRPTGPGLPRRAHGRAGHRGDPARRRPPPSH